MACMVAKWNGCAFCVGAHGAVAAKEMQRPAVDEVFSDFRTAPISERLKSALAFLEVMTLRPKDLWAEHAKAALSAGVSPDALIDAIAVGALFSIVTRYADALDFAMPTPEELERAAKMLLKPGYAS
jgi:alkylhydroperoxidase family enzyme